jgi:hypothetical protein
VAGEGTCSGRRFAGVVATSAAIVVIALLHRQATLSKICCVEARERCLLDSYRLS